MEVYYQKIRSSYKDTLKLLESDIQHANSLTATIPCTKGGARVQMKLVYNNMTPMFLFLLQWLDSSCTYLLPRYIDLFHVLIYKVYKDESPIISSLGRKATIREFYAVILPSLQQLHGDLKVLDSTSKDKSSSMMLYSKKNVLDNNSICDNLDLERESECGICLEPGSKVVSPNCCHEMCLNCYRDWNIRSESCPFCRGTLKRVRSEDLWVLTCSGDVVDIETAFVEELSRFYVYINSLPKDAPDVLFFFYYEFLL